MTKDILTFKEAADYCGFKESYFYQLTSKKQVPFYKPRGKKLFFKVSELQDWLLRGKSESIDVLESNAIREFNTKK